MQHQIVIHCIFFFVCITPEDLLAFCTGLWRKKKKQCSPMASSKKFIFFKIIVILPINIYMTSIYYLFLYSCEIYLSTKPSCSFFPLWCIKMTKIPSIDQKTNMTGFRRLYVKLSNNLVLLALLKSILGNLIISVGIIDIN